MREEKWKRKRRKQNEKKEAESYAGSFAGGRNSSSGVNSLCGIGCEKEDQKKVNKNIRAERAGGSAHDERNFRFFEYSVGWMVEKGSM